MNTTLMMTLLGLMAKHFVADYLLQSPWMIRGKGDLRLPGGYVHAGIHAILTAVVLVPLLGLTVFIFAITASEFVIHYLLDFAKVHYTAGAVMLADPRKYWACHGFDQLLHGLTYAGILYAAGFQVLT